MSNAPLRRAAHPAVEADLAVGATHPARYKHARVRPTDSAGRIAERLLASLDRGGRHPVLVGPPEVGKSAVVDALAERIAAIAALGRRAPKGAPKALWQVSLRGLETFSQKDDSLPLVLHEVLAAAASSPARPIVYMPDLRLLRAFDAQLQFVLTHALSRMPVRFLGEAWPAMLGWLEEDPELSSVLYAVPIEEPSPERAVEVLRARNVAGRAACARAVELAQRLLPQRRLPGKALALLSLASREAGDEPLTAPKVTRSVCRSLRVPRYLADGRVAFSLDEAGAALRARCVGMDEAIDAALERIAAFRAGLLDARRPIGVLMLAGPTGAGRGAFAAHAAEVLFGSARRLVRVPMAEHGEDWRVDQLFGQRAGQTLEARRGTLARYLAGRPFAVVHFSEVEKAHPLVLKFLLGVLENGSYLNGADEEVTLRNTLVVLSTTVELERFQGGGLGFGPATVRGAGAESVRRRVLEQLPEELLARVDRLCVCPPLGPAAAALLVERELRAAVARSPRFRPRDDGSSPTLELAPGVCDALAGRALAGRPSLDARAVGRSVERLAYPALAAALLRFDRARDAGLRVSLAAERDDATLAVTALPRADAQREHREATQKSKGPRPVAKPAPRGAKKTSPRAGARRGA